MYCKEEGQTLWQSLSSVSDETLREFGFIILESGGFKSGSFKSRVRLRLGTCHDVITGLVGIVIWGP